MRALCDCLPKCEWSFLLSVSSATLVDQVMPSNFHLHSTRALHQHVHLALAHVSWLQSADRWQAADRCKACLLVLEVALKTRRSRCWFPICLVTPLLLQEVRCGLVSLQDGSKEAVLKKARIIGCTTTGLAGQKALIMGAVSPGIVVVEEAAELLESHVLTSLTPETQHLIMIGDHKQLRPKVPFVFIWLGALVMDGFCANRFSPAQCGFLA